MRKVVVIGLIVLALGAVAVIVPAAASQDAPSGAHWAARPGQSSTGLAPQAAGDSFTTNDNFVTVTWNHLGKASLGSVVSETWLNTGFNSSNTAVNTQGVTRSILLPKAVRVATRVQLRGVDVNGIERVLATSSTLNSSGRLSVQVATPEITLASSTSCFFFTVVSMAIRWSDGRLSSVTFDQPIGFTPGATACPAA